jgi:hypothetical protein
MIKVFEDFDITQVAHYQSVLESNGIDTFMKNQFGTSGSGEIPFIEVVPELWVLNASDEKQARSLIAELQGPDTGEPTGPWECAACGTPQEAVFTHCWKCSEARAA